MNGEKYKTLAGMLALRRFTVADLAHYTGVKASTVRSVIGRFRNLIRESGSRPTGKPGGQEKAYEVQQKEVPRIEKLLGDLFDRLKVVRTEKSVTPCPIGLNTAEDAIQRHKSQPTSRDVKNVLETAWIDLKGANAEIEELAAVYGESSGISEMRARSKEAETYLRVFKLKKAKDTLQQRVKRFPAEAVSIAEELGHQVNAIAVLAQTNPMGRWRHAVTESFENVSVVFNSRLEGLKDRVQACIPIQIPEYRLGDDGVESELNRLASQSDPAGVCLLINSKYDAEEVYKILEHSGWSYNPFVVLDADFDNDLRNEILSHSARYAGHAEDLKDRAIQGIFGITSRSQAQPDCATVH
jgi:hypothetical protein